jgi:hypothetical protein
VGIFVGILVGLVGECIILKAVGIPLPHSHPVLTVRRTGATFIASIYSLAKKTTCASKNIYWNINIFEQNSGIG